MRHLRQVGAVIALLLVAGSVASAQRTAASSSPRVWELGVDAGLSFGLDDPNVTTFQIPVQNIRAGVHIAPNWSVEPFLGYNYVKVEGADAFSVYQFGVGALYHFSTDRARSQMYLRPSIQIVGVSGGGASDSEAGIGVGIGMKWPKLGGRIAWRGEANVTAINDATTLGALFGLSLFTR
jgi:hypothetical protein